MGVHYGRRIWEALGLKQEKDFDERLAKLTPEELTKLHQVHSFRIGGAMTGVVINGILMFVFPSNVVGTTLNLRQLVVAHRSRREIEEAARAYHGRDLREGSDRASKKRHLLAGAAQKSVMTFVFLGQDDFVAAASELFGMDLASPATAPEVVTKEMSDMFYTSSGFEGFHEVADHFSPANHVNEALGFEHNPTWDQLCQGGSMSFVAVAGIGIGVAAEANVASLAVDAAGEELHKQTLRGGNQRGVSATAAAANASHGAWAHSGRREAARPQRPWS
jgi:hypothetical protein